MTDAPPDAARRKRSRRSTSDRLLGVVLAAIFVAMAVELVLLVLQNRELKRTITEMSVDTSAPVTRVAPELLRGDRVEPLELPALAGGTVRLGYEPEDGDTLLLIFSPNCPACQANMPRWVEVAERYASRGGAHYLSTADEAQTRRFAEEYGLDGSVLLAGYAAMTGYKITHTPTTVLVEPGGVVREVWVGLLPEDAEL